MATKKKSATVKKAAKPKRRAPSKKAAPPKAKAAAKKKSAAVKKSQQRGRKTTVKCVSVPNELCAQVQAHADASDGLSFSAITTAALTAYMKTVPKSKKRRR